MEQCRLCAEEGGVECVCHRNKSKSFRGRGAVKRLYFHEGIKIMSATRQRPSVLPLPNAMPLKSVQRRRMTFIPL